MEGLITLIVVILAIIITVRGGGNSSSKEETKPTQKKNRELEFLVNKWNDIQVLFDSEQENDWRIAIIETDILIYKMMLLADVYGDTHIEKINNLPSKFKDRNTLYYLHQIRNQVAHKGYDFHLDKEKSNQIRDAFHNFLLSIG